MNESPKIGPGNGRELFRKLRKLGLSDPVKSREIVFRSEHDKLLEVGDSLRMSSPYYWEPLDTPFSFLASTSLSGEGNPCFDISCRIGRSKGLGRFAALYADTVLIRDPFEKLFIREDSDMIRLEFYHTLAVLIALRPEIEAGLIGFAPTDFPLSEEGLAKFRRVEEKYRDELAIANEIVLQAAEDHVQAEISNMPEYSYLTLEGVERFIPHEDLDLVPVQGMSEWESGHDLSPQEVRAAIQRWILDPSFNDLQFNNIITWLYRTNYLTDRPVDLDLVGLIGDENKTTNSSAIARVNHSLPFVDGLDTETILKLRKEEGEAFRVYRDKISTLVDDKSLSEDQFKEAFRDLVEPELNKIDKSVASARKMVKREIRDQLVFGSGLVTIGMALGTVSPSVGAITSAVGGANSVPSFFLAVRPCSASRQWPGTVTFTFSGRLGTKERILHDAHISLHCCGRQAAARYTSSPNCPPSCVV